MRLSTFSDYSLRVLLYLGERPSGLISIGEIAAWHEISESHLMKVVLHLGRCGYVQTVRGKGGGLRLARPPAEIGLGEVLRQTETDFAMADCFGTTYPCRIDGICRVKGVLREALQAMFLVLDSYTLGDLLADPDALPLATPAREDARHA